MRSSFFFSHLRPFLERLTLIGILLLMPSLLLAQKVHPNLPLCLKTAERCDIPQKTFAPYELPFHLPEKLIANDAYESAPFYAIVLHTDAAPACDGGEYTLAVEQFRQRAQKRFPGRRVFASHQCPDMAAVYYTRLDVPKKENSVESFVAVYAGATLTQARTVLKHAQTLYPKSSLQHLRVGYSYIVQ